MRMVIMGAPGAGKGTQSQAIGDHYQIPAISTGDIFRANVAAGTPLGREAKRIMDAGEYISDDITNGIVADRLDEADARQGFLLDGYPRTLAQVETLDQIVHGQGVDLDVVLQLHADTEVVVERLTRRAETDGRTDDTEESIRVRMQVYESETAPLLNVYRDRGLLVTVDGIGEVDDVSKRIFAALDQRV